MKPRFHMGLALAMGLCGWQTVDAAKAKHPSHPPRCAAWFSPGMGEIFWHLEVSGDTVEFAKLSEAWPGEGLAPEAYQEKEGHTVTAVWRHRDVTGLGAEVCRTLAATDWVKAEPPVLDGAVYVLRSGGQGTDQSKGQGEKVLGLTPGNRERFTDLLDAIDSLGEITRHSGSLVFALQWRWQGQKAPDLLALPGTQVKLWVRRQGSLQMTGPRPTTKGEPKMGVTGELRYSLEAWERQFPGPPTLDTAMALPSACMLGLNDQGGKVGQGRASESAWVACPIDLPPNWKNAQVMVRGKLPLLSGPQPFRAASAYLIRE